MSRTITVDALNNWLKKEDVVLIDVREPAEHRFMHIAQARHIPLSRIKYDEFLSSSERIVVHCASGRRSERVCRELLQKNPLLKVYSLEGGINAWKQEGFPVTSAGKKVLPLDRQVQLTAGFLVFSGTLFGYFIHPAYLGVPAFVGTGLMFAGLSGTCGMAKLLARMPWNI